MIKKTIHETEATYGEKAAGIVRGWHEAQDEIARSHEPVEGGFSEYLTDEGRARVVRERKAERAGAAASEFRRKYEAMTKERNEAVRDRTSALRDELFRVEDSGALSRAALATDAELGAMLELAAHAGSKDLARAVFAAAAQRELGDVLSTYFERVDPQAHLYAELKEAPSEESLERRLADAQIIFAAPDASDFAPTLGATA
jgi:hypothetical protein